MSSFTEPLYLTPSSDGLWSTTRTFGYEIGRKGSGLLITVPEGFRTDLGTIPAPARVLVNPADARSSAAYVLHDWLCRDAGFSRLTAAYLLYEGLRVLGVGRLRSGIVFVAVLAWAVLRPVSPAVPNT